VLTMSIAAAVLVSHSGETHLNKALAAPPAATVEPVLRVIPDLEAEDGALIAQGMKLLDASQFDELDQLIQKLSRDEFEYSDGRRKIDLLAHGLAMLPLTSGPQGQHWHETLNSWHEQQPDSAAASLVFGDALAAEAWTAEHRPWCDLSAQERQALEKRLSVAATLCKAASTSAPTWPAVGALQLRIARIRQIGQQDYERLYTSLSQSFPGYKMLHFQKAIYLQSTCGGNGWGHFAYELGKDDVLYAQIVWYVQSASTSFDALKPAISWSRLKQGFTELLKKRPDALCAASEYCYFAVAFADQKMARDLFLNQIKNRVELSVWQQPTKFLAAYHWALST
jgi:hypothetical protein